MLFLRAEEDFVPYTPRDKRNLHENLRGLGPGVPAESLELAIRKEVRATGERESLPAGPGAAEMTPDHSSALLSRACIAHLPALLGPVLATGPAHGQPEEGPPFPALLAPAPFPHCFAPHTQHPYEEEVWWAKALGSPVSSEPKGWVASLLLVSEVPLSTLYRFVKASEAVDMPQRCANRVWATQCPPRFHRQTPSPERPLVVSHLPFRPPF